jgi:FkbM family methyltransferase
MEYEIHETCQIDRKILSRVYEYFFAGKTDGWFVEVGAFDGVTTSNTWGLARAGWNGLYIEASPDSAKACVDNYKDYPNIIVDCCAVSNFEGKTKYYYGGDVGAITMNKVNQAWGLDPNHYTTVPVFRLDTLLEKYNVPKEYDLLVVDVEESELDVLEGYNIHLWTPKVAIIETHEGEHPQSVYCTHGINLLAERVSDYFLSAGYRKVGYDKINTIFARY